MSCTEIKFLDGGTLANVHIHNSEIIGGTMSGTELSNIVLKGNVTIDPATGAGIVNQLCQYIQECVFLSFTDCNGAPHAHGAKIPNCVQVLEMIQEYHEPVFEPATPLSTVADKLPTTMYGAREKLLGVPATWMKVAPNLYVPVYTV